MIPAHLRKAIQRTDGRLKARTYCRESLQREFEPQDLLALDYWIQHGNCGRRKNEKISLASLSCQRVAWQVVDENTPWDGGLFAVSSFGFGGSNVHTVLRGTGKERSQSLYSKPSPKNTGLLNGRREERDSADILPLAARSSEGLQAVAKLILEVGSLPKWSSLP